MTHRKFWIPLLALLPTAAFGQGDLQAKQELGARSFFPPEYGSEFFVDVQAVLDTDLWEVLERSLLKGPFLLYFRKEFGCRLDSLQQIQGAMTNNWNPAGEQGQEADADELEPQSRTVVAFTGRKELQLPKLREKDERQAETIAGHAVIAWDNDDWQGSSKELLLRPKPKVLIYGDRELIESVLSGKRRGGVPRPQLTSLLAGAKRPLAYVARNIADGEEWGSVFWSFEEEMFAAEDPLREFLIRLDLDPKSDAKYPAVVLQVIFRFETGEVGPDFTKEFMQNSVASLPEEEKLKRLIAPLVKLLESMQYETDGRDLRVTLNFGGKAQRAALSDIMTLAIPFLYLMPMGVGAQPIPMQVAPAAALQPAQPAAEPEEAK